MFFAILCGYYLFNNFYRFFISVVMFLFNFVIFLHKFLKLFFFIFN